MFDLTNDGPLATCPHTERGIIRSDIQRVCGLALHLRVQVQSVAMCCRTHGAVDIKRVDEPLPEMAVGDEPDDDVRALGL